MMATRVLPGTLVAEFRTADRAALPPRAIPWVFRSTFQDQPASQRIIGVQPAAEDNAQLPDTVAKSTNPQGFA